MAQDSLQSGDSKNSEQEQIKEQDSLLEFPCDFPIKVMGLSHPEFKSTIAAAVRELIPDFEVSSVTASRSKTGKYTALTVTVRATSRAQLDSLYMMLTSHPMVKVVL